MKVKEMMERFGLQLASGAGGLDRDVRGGYSGDLLSDVMANAPVGCVWLTVQGHQNVVAVAVLRETAAIVVCMGRQADEETLLKAEREGIPVLTWPGSAYALAGRLAAAGVAG